MTPLPLDQDLSDRIRGGSSEALEGLYRAAGARLYALAWRLTFNRADAEDIVHDLFVGLPGALAGYRERGRFEAWLKRLLVRTALMKGRGRRRQLERDSAYAAEMQREISPSTPWEEGGAERLLATLPETLRPVVLLREIEGMSHAEIGKALGISEAASRLRLWRGLEQLRKAIRKQR